MGITHGDKNVSFECCESDQVRPHSMASFYDDIDGRYRQAKTQDLSMWPSNMRQRQQYANWPME